MCSVLFADLVGFTPLSESRDAEAVRELLSGYFDVARTVIGRYGGSVEKFIGDAVMAVWGVPDSHEDDAERCVRAGLELVDAVAGYGEERGVPGLTARAGVVTGEVAVTLGATDEGMVAGDAVNTASRVQAAAEPGTVLVDDRSRQTALRAIAFADTGRHELKGKSEPVRLWRAVRVLGSVGGAERVDGLEASFLGRAREFRLLKDAFHASAEAGRARLISVLGVAGVGKSRLGWEFNKYIDGLAEAVLWHSGRCLSYGEGVAFWALAEMVRQRFAIPEQDSPDQAAQKLAAGLERWIGEPADREFLSPRLGALLGLAEPGLGREELFAGWRLFFERLAEQSPVILAFEDMHWADAGLCDFVDHLLDWSAESAIFIVCFARPDLLDRRPSFGGVRRNATTLPLDPLPPPVMHTLLGELVPGLPGEVAGRIVAQADGIPLYAVETVRSLIDRDLVRPVDGIYRLVGQVDALAVPASLASLIAARIDALPSAERTLVQDLAVLGTTFPRGAAGAVSRQPEAELDRLLSDLVRREILAVRADRLSPDRGQYSFTQALLRQVAYDTLSRRERKARHLTVAAHLRSAFPDDGAEVAEPVAQHYRDALEAVPDDPDAAAIRAEAVTAFSRAGGRAMTLGAPQTAGRAYGIAAELATEEAQRAGLLERAGEADMLVGRASDALARFEQCRSMHAAAGRPREAARIADWVGYALSRLGRGAESIPQLRAALALLDDGTEDAALARVQGGLGAMLLASGQTSEALAHVDRAMAIAEALELPDVLARAAAQRGFVLRALNRPREGLAQTEWAVRLAEESRLSGDAMVARGNAADLCITMDWPGAVEHCEAALRLARRRGDRDGEAWAAAELALAQLGTGAWDAAETLCKELLADPGATACTGSADVAFRLMQFACRRGQMDQARDWLGPLEKWKDDTEVQCRTMYQSAVAMLALADGDAAGALAEARVALEQLSALGASHEAIRQSWPDATEAALQLGDLEAADGLVATLAARPPGHVPQYLRAELARYRARIAAARGQHDEVVTGFAKAEDTLETLGYPYPLALVRLDHADWLTDQSRAAEAAVLYRQTVETFDALRAAPGAARAREGMARAEGLSSAAVTGSAP